MKSQARLEALKSWKTDIFLQLGIEGSSDLASVSDDASFRRYFRVQSLDRSFIFVDAPPEKEDNESFVAIAAKLAEAQLTVPSVLQYDFEKGFLLLTDLGDRLLLPELQRSDVSGQEGLYKNAMAVAHGLSKVNVKGLPAYDSSRLLDEMMLFPQWFSQQFPMIEWGTDTHQKLDAAMNIMVESALEQPTIFVHRDFHARNLMITPSGELAMIDFQDAVTGPITYDLVSLLKDCYWRLPRASVERLVETFRQDYSNSISSSQFLRWFDFMGFQRHLKCAGIFSRLNLRDGKPGYLNDIPLVIDYLCEVAERYPELNSIGTWLTEEVRPKVSSQD